MRTLLAQSASLDDDPCALWSVALLPATTLLAQFMYPWFAHKLLLYLLMIKKRIESRYQMIFPILFLI